MSNSLAEDRNIVNSLMKIMIKEKLSEYWWEDKWQNILRSLTLVVEVAEKGKIKWCLEQMRLVSFNSSHKSNQIQK